MLRRGPSLPFNSPHAPVRVRVRACERACECVPGRACSCLRTPVRERARLCPEVRACPAVRVCARLCVAACVRVRACLRARACCACVRSCLAYLCVACLARPSGSSLAALTVPGCGGRRSSAGLSSGLHPRTSVSRPQTSASYPRIVQCYCGGSSSRVLAVPLEALLGLNSYRSSGSGLLPVLDQPFCSHSQRGKAGRHSRE